MYTDLVMSDNDYKIKTKNYFSRCNHLPGKL
jgi:translation initiation factor IF-1